MTEQMIYKYGVHPVLTAVGFILAILTVILLITRPRHRDAPPTWAGKVVGWALGFSHNAWRGYREQRDPFRA